MEESFVNETNDREACLKRWIVGLVQMNCEKEISTLLSKASYEAYMPMQRETHQRSDRKEKVNRFIISISSDQIDGLRFMHENIDSAITIESPLYVGDKVRIVRGSLKGLKGNLCALKDKKHIVAIILEYLGYTCVGVTINDINNELIHIL